MVRKTPVKKLLEVAFKVIKSLEERKLEADGIRENGAMLAEKRLSKRDNRSKRRKRRVRKAARIIGKHIGNAFEKSGLDIDKDEDWKTLLLWTYAAIYGGKGRGHPKKWSTKKLRKLQQEIDDIEHQHPDLTELDCCKKLIRKSEDGRYNGVDNARTLRRVLQNSKRVSKDARLIASLRDDAVATHLINELKERR